MNNREALQEIWRQALAGKRFMIDLPTRKEADKFRWALYKARSGKRLPDDVALARTSCVASIREDGGRWWVCVERSAAADTMARVRESINSGKQKR